MARKSPSQRSRRRKPLVVWPIHQTMSLGALANNNAFEEEFLNLNDDVFFISCDLVWSMYNHTAGEGPIVVGFSNSVLSVAEIIEAVDASPTGKDDILAVEKARRPVRTFAAFQGSGADETLNDGKPIRSVIKLPIGADFQPAFWALNRSGAALTTGTVISVNGKIYGRWVR